MRTECSREIGSSAALSPLIPRLLTTSRGPVEYVIQGDGPAVLVLHGALGGYDQGLILAHTIGDAGFRYVSLSRPGYLGTPLSDGRTPTEQADLYREVLEALGIRAVAVMAVSGGGGSALQFALSHRDRCWGLVMVSSYCARIATPLPLGWYILKLAAHCPPLAAAMRRRAKHDLERSSHRSELRAALRDPETGPLLRALQASTWDRMVLRFPGTQNDVATTRSNLCFPLEQLAVPVLVVHGTDDRAVPFAHAQMLASRAPGAELLAVPGGEHGTIFTHRTQVRARVTQFLRAHTNVSVPAILSTPTVACE
ncbi:MAG TPA: alpha/beta hydrolase [Anaeromyxobacteraceae bacterium]|nr:alpha/beta hydrolase [Anaeromyxobacteraceae bacterium]